MTPDARRIAELFSLEGPVARVESFPGGHVNKSYLLTCRMAPRDTPYLLQHINRRVFPDPAAVMENITRVLAHVQRKLETGAPGTAGWRCLELVPTRDGRMFARAGGGSCWRVYRYIEGAHVRLAVEQPAQAEQAGRAFGTFQRWLADFPAACLHETIRGFHDTPARMAAFERAVEEDAAGHAARVRDEIDFLRRRAGQAGRLIELLRAGRIPQRVVHNDAKLSNVLLDAVTNEAVCVVDLDTVMPGLSLFDFGDMVRSMTTIADEDEEDLARVELDLALFEALARGYLAAAGAFLNRAEREHLVLAGWLITLEQAARFLADFLAGDVYYATRKPDHNLVRCRTQLKLIECVERHEREMERVVRSL